MKLFRLLLLLLVPVFAFAQNNPGANHANKFEPMTDVMRAPNSYRTASGEPGPDYWQQQGDYKIKCSLDVENQRLTGEEMVTYTNHSPNTLRYIWLQLDENEHDANAEKQFNNTSRINPIMSKDALRNLEPANELEEKGCRIQSVKDAQMKDLKYRIDGTNMQIYLPMPLKPGESFTFNIKWFYNMINRMDSTSWGRGGYEHFDDTDDYIFTVVQWFPRMCVYSDFEGWQTKQFMGTGEFALNFGNYEVEITLPKDYMVASTGECQNYDKTLTSTQLSRWKQAQTANKPVEIVTLAEAKVLEAGAKSKETQTWIYKADNVRDFAWGASRKFVWDAMPYENELGQTAMCMSYYGKEAFPIYNRYSTKAVVHTLQTYDKYSLPYPYPTAISVEAANGMEYPMICFNPGRAEEDGTYTEAAKNACITVVIHEVGHNYFPMIINSDERQWAWFDEGLNSFVQFLAEQEWDYNYDSGGGPAHLITDYMSRPKDKLEPIMTSSDNIKSYFANAYNKPAAGLNMLRETIMGREAFDYAFKEYCRRWAFKHPTPEDFFRTMEDASGMDLDWFWRGWFYSTDAVDISLDSITWYKVDLKKNPKKDTNTYDYAVKGPEFETISQKRNKEEEIKFDVEADKELQDFYTYYKPWETSDSIVTYVTELYEEQFSKKEKKKLYGDQNYYELNFSNKGGLPMPVIIEWTFKDGTTELERIPVSIWRKNEDKFTKVFVKNKEVSGIVIDPYHETADIDERNNNWPVKELPSRFQVYKANKSVKPDNAMQKAIKAGKTIKP
ncbi:MAG: hypothetical protein ACI85O_003137 [Saprospiraceae bacterium]|jgi:hypothetical protein